MENFICLNLGKQLGKIRRYHSMTLKEEAFYDRFVVFLMNCLQSEKHRSCIQAPANCWSGEVGLTGPRSQELSLGDPPCALP